MDSPREGKSDGEDDDDVASPSIVSSGSSVSSSSDEHSSSENGMDESGSDEDPDKGEEEELNAVDSEEENLFSLLSSTSFSVSSSSASASESPSQQDSDQKDRQNEGKGEKELLESMRMALVKMYAAQKQSRRVQREALRRARKLQHDNRRLRDELRRALSQKTAFSWRGEEDGSEEDSREVAPVVAPGMCKQPADAAKPWCLFWNQHGHVSKVTSAGKTVLEIFNFSPAAALSGSSRKRIADYTGACMAALSKVGVALASIGTRRPPLPSRVEFRSLQDSSQWTKSLPPLEKPTGIAVGDSFVAVTTSCDFLRIFATSGITLSLTKLPGVPVALCASQQLLFVVMATSSLETSTSSLELLNSREQRENQSRRYERLRKTTSKKKRFYTCLLLHIHPTPSSPASPYLLPFGCQDRISQLPGLLAKVFPSIDVIHEGPLVLDYPLDWINISTGGMAAIKDTSGQIWGLMPAWGRATEGPVPYRLSWLPLVNLSEAAGESIEETPRHVSSIKFWPLYVDEVKGEILVIRLKSHSKASTTDASGSLKESDEGTSSSSPSHGSSSSSWFHSSPPPEEPNCSQVSPLFGYTMEHLPLRLPFTDIWPYPRWQQLLLKDKHLKGIVASSSSSSSGTGRGVKDGQGNSSTSSAVLPMGEAALVPWQQFDEIRWRNEVVMRLMCIALRNWEGGGAGGGAGGPENQQDMLKMEQQKESADAEKKFTNLMKTHDRYALRQFLVCREDRRLHPAALDVAIRFKMPGVAAHARQSLEGDTRLQSEKLREALEWQVGEQQGGGEEELGLAGSLSPSSTQPLGSSYRSATLRTGGRHSFGSNENEKPAGLRGSWDSSDGAKRVTGGMNSKKLTDTLEEHPRRPSPVGQMQAPAAKSWMKGGNSGKSDRNQHHKFGGFLHVADS
ncbi:hypothetical protein CSUI_007912 [Cystoisospora suis]|uniref:WDHD1/CFT4 second beta-propeller domain-containing protein n=1 Tax=Cystoisospora suis TaxID=483139 RepID=A0A2C6KP60_9APIC|nr:hypothetical protein CSUI_007912 [Cystoisospora suis]